MKRRWLPLLGVAAGAYLLITSGWLTSFFANSKADYIRTPDYQRYWSESFGRDALVNYQLSYSCGHTVMVAEPDLSPELLMVAPGYMASTVHAMQMETRRDGVIVVHGQVPEICPDCQNHFWVGEQDGCVAVWRGKDRESAVFLQRYEDMSVARLPAEVQHQLEIGIVVHSEDELAQVLEGLDR